MSNVPEPRRYPGHLRAADADRAIVTDLLSAAYAEGRLTREEHDTRLAQAMEAKSFDDLRALTGDLVPDANTGRTVGAFSLAGARYGSEARHASHMPFSPGLSRLRQKAHLGGNRISNIPSTSFDISSPHRCAVYFWGM